MLITEKKLNKIIDEVNKKYEKHKVEVEIVQFYTLAKKYGFCNPYCECGDCLKVNKPV